MVKTERKWIKRTVIALAVVLVVLCAAGLVVGNIFYNLALNPNSSKDAVTGAEHNQIDNSGFDEPEAEARRQWVDSVTFDDRYLESRDDLRLHSYVLEQDSDLWLVSCHGYTGEAIQMTSSAYQFYQRGYNILMPDARGHGQSEGDYIGMGWDDRLDVVDWIEQIVQWNPEAQIVLYGVSMGGATVMMVSGEDLPSNVKAIVEDCGYTGVWQEFAYQLKMLFRLPEFPVLHASSVVTKLRAGWWLGEGNAVEQVAKSVTPMLFIHGDEDTFVPFSMVYEAYDAANVEKDVIVVEGAGHGGAASVMGSGYWEAVFAFVGRFLD